MSKELGNRCLTPISATQLRQRLAGHGELALLDAREQGVHYRGHPFYASSAPLSRLEMLIAGLVPRRSAPIVVFDGGEGPAQLAADRLAELGYTSVEILQGGCAAWQAAGGELFSGINVPSKAFGEFVEHAYETPRITAEELEKLRASELPFYLNLMAHLARHGIPCPQPIANLDNEYLGTLNGKPASMVTCVPGADLKQVNAGHCASIGSLLAEMHLAGASYRAQMPNPRGPRWWKLTRGRPCRSRSAAALASATLRNTVTPRASSRPSTPGPTSW